MHEEAVQRQRPPVRRAPEVLQVLDDHAALLQNVRVRLVLIAQAPLVAQNLVRLDPAVRAPGKHLLDQVDAGLRVLKFINRLPVQVHRVHAHQTHRVPQPAARLGPVLGLIEQVPRVVRGVHVDHVLVVQPRLLLVQARLLNKALGCGYVRTYCRR